MRFLLSLSYEDFEEFLTSIGFRLHEHLFDETTNKHIPSTQVCDSMLVCRCLFNNSDYIREHSTLVDKNIEAKLKYLKYINIIASFQTNSDFNTQILLMDDFRCYPANCGEYDKDVLEFYTKSFHRFMSKKFGKEYVDALKQNQQNQKNNQQAFDQSL